MGKLRVEVDDVVKDEGVRAHFCVLVNFLKLFYIFLDLKEIKKFVYIFFSKFMLKIPS